MPDEPAYVEKPPRFWYSGSLRIFGNISSLEEIGRTLGLAPTHVHQRGEIRRPGAEPYQKDMWSYKVPIDENESLHVHIDALWNTIRAHKGYLLGLKKDLDVDVFLGYRSDCDHCGVDVPHTSLQMFIELEIPFGMSIIVV